MTLPARTGNRMEPFHPQSKPEEGGERSRLLPIHSRRCFLDQQFPGVSRVAQAVQGPSEVARRRRRVATGRTACTS